MRVWSSSRGSWLSPWRSWRARRSLWCSRWGERVVSLREYKWKYLCVCIVSRRNLPLFCFFFCFFFCSFFQVISLGSTTPFHGRQSGSAGLRGQGSLRRWIGGAPREMRAGSAGELMGEPQGQQSQSGLPTNPNLIGERQSTASLHVRLLFVCVFFFFFPKF